MATTASAARTTSALRASPRPVGSATTTQPLAASRSVPGSSPTVSPPRERAPRHAASMTPPSPPQTSPAPASATAAPASSARTSSASAARPGPTIAIHARGGGTGSPHDEVHEPAGHDDHLHDLVAVEMPHDVRPPARERLQLLARRVGR